MHVEWLLVFGQFERLFDFIGAKDDGAFGGATRAEWSRTPHS